MKLPWFAFKSQFYAPDDASGGGDPTFQDVVKKGIEELTGKKAEEDKKDEKKEDKKEEKQEEKKEEKKEEKDPDEITKATELMAAMKDPAARKDLITALAIKEGILGDILNPKTKEDKKEAEDSIKDILVKKLGDDYKFIAPLLGEALEEILAAHTKKTVEPIKEDLKKKSEEEQKQIILKGYDDAFAKYEGAKELEKEVGELTTKFRPGEKQGPEEYFSQLILLAAANKGKILKVVAAGDKKENVKDFDKERAKRNANDATSRLASERGELGDDEDLEKLTKGKGRSDIVETVAAKVAAAMGIK